MSIRRCFAVCTAFLAAMVLVGCGSGSPTNTAPTEKQLEKEQKSGPQGGPKSK